MTATLALPAPVYRYETREAWLVAAVDLMGVMFREAGESLPRVRVSVGWPGGPGSKNSVIGQCWATRASADAVAQVFISPVLDNPVRILDVLAHELVHAVDDCQSGHRGRFVKIAKAIGLAGKPTATVASPRLQRRLARFAATLGPYPHARISTTGSFIVPKTDPKTGLPVPGPSDTPKKQGTRMLKAECPDTGYKVRLTRLWLDEYGAPLCPCHQRPMTES